jgi:DNA polymerase-3 subunit alpha
LVATNDCHYLLKEHWEAHDVLLCIQTGKTLKDEKRMRMESPEFYFKSPQEMQESFKWCPEALSNTLEIAANCDIVFPKKTYYFPAIPGAEESDVGLDQRLIQQATAGLESRLDDFASRGIALTDEQRAVYEKRLEHEIGIINQVGFPGYFLIVADFVAWAKSKSIPVGPGRGSAVGSLAAWCLGITDVDPIHYGLLFERFLNPERISMPDIDVDFCAEGRNEVIRYVTDTYGGSDYVAQIITLGQMKAKAVVRDVGRALGLPYASVDAIAKMIPNQLNISLKAAIESNPALKDVSENDPEIKKLIEYALVLENLPRHTSIHASGVVIGDRPLMDHLPLCCDSKSPEENGRKIQVITQYELGGVEDNGLIKFDFLGLKTLTLIKHCLRLLAEKGIKEDLDALDFKDPLTYELLARGEVSGIFQLESAGIRGVLMRLKPQCLEDIITLVAIYRPGPINSGMVDEYIRIKHGQEQPHYVVEQLRPILSETLGVILYQEQVMRIAQSLAGYSLGEADLLRKAMGKKLPEVMRKHKTRFMDGAKANDIPVDKAERIFALMAEFAQYGFNKSHSAGYAVVTFRTAWLKAHYPLEFLAALMTSEKSDHEKISTIIRECRKRKIAVLPPDVNSSDFEFSVADDSILFGLGAVKGLGQTAIEAIINARKKKPFADIFDFCQRAGSQKVNRRVIEALIKCGAFDRSGGAPRESLLAVLDQAIEQGAASRQKKLKSSSANLFSVLPAPPAKQRVWPEAAPLSETERLALEKELLGFYVSGHPLARFEAAMAAMRNINISEIERVGDGSKLRLCGTLTSINEKVGKNGKPFVFAALEDSDGSTVELVMWNNVYKKKTSLVENGRLVLIDGVLEKQNEEKKYRRKINVTEILDLEEAVHKMTRSVTVNTSLDELENALNFFSERQTPTQSPDQKGHHLAEIYLCINDGIGQAVYHLEKKAFITVDFFEQLSYALPFSQYNDIQSHDVSNPWGYAEY